MSKPGDNGAAREAAGFDRLESAIGELVDGLAEALDRAGEAEARNAELAKLVERFTGNQEEAGQLVSRLKRLEAENADLRSRLERGAEGVDRMIARIRFLENQA